MYFSKVCFNKHKFIFWVLFALVWIYIYIQSEVFYFNGSFLAIGDLSLYHSWISKGINSGVWPILDYPSVYPPYAFIPMLFVGIFSFGNDYIFKVIWYVLMMLTWGIVLNFLLRQIDNNLKNKISNNIKDIFLSDYGSCFYALLYMAAMGAIFAPRIDCFASAIGLFALIYLCNNEKIASSYFTFTAWTKIFIGGYFIPLLFTSYNKFKNIILPAILTSIPIGILMLISKNPFFPLSFLQSQTDRHLQIESIAATPFILLELFTGTKHIKYNRQIRTHEIVSHTCNWVGDMLNLVLILGIIIIIFLIYKARKADKEQLVLISGLALILGLIVFNKVGSPQYYTALLPSLAFSLSTQYKKKWKLPCILGLFIALFTQFTYPGLRNYIWAYGPNHYIGVIALSIRNGLVVLLFAVVIYNLFRLGKRKKI